MPVSRRFQNRITGGRSTLPAVILLSALCWAAAAVLAPERPEAQPAGYALWQPALLQGLPRWASLPAGYLLYGLAGYLLVVLNNTYAIIRMRASAQTSVFLMLVAACPRLHPLHAGNVAVLALLPALFFLFNGYRHPRPSASLFHAFAFLGLGFLAFPPLAFLIPVFWIGAYNFHALNLKSFFASLLGWGLPCWFLLGHAWFHGEMELFLHPFRELGSLGAPFRGWTVELVPTLAYVALLLAVSGAHCLVAGHEDKIRTRSYLHFLLLLSFVLLAGIVLQPRLAQDLLPPLLAGVSILSGHLFVLTSGRGSNLFFTGMLAALFLLSAYNLWTLLQIP